MYSPPHYREDDPAVIRSLLEAYPFALLIAAGEAGLEAVHLPLLYHADPPTLARAPLGLLRGHVARPNGIWRAFDGQREGLAVFIGPHAYISPAWYASRPQVPTWNYTAVHAYGVPRVMDEPALVRAHLHELVARLEAGQPQPWSVAQGGATEHLERLLPGLVAFEMPITRLDGKSKLNQNRTRADREGVIAALARSADSGARGIAALLQDRLAMDTPVASEAD